MLHLVGFVVSRLYDSNDLCIYIFMQNFVYDRHTHIGER